VKDKVAFITGASRGVGAAVGRAFHEAGAQVALASRSGDDLGLAGALGVECDVRNPASVEAAVGATVERFGRLDVVVANAGVGSYGPFLEMDPEDVEAMIDINLKGTIYAARFGLPHLIESKGDFVSLASVAGLRAFPGEAVYNASKFGQVGFTRALDHEMREQGVRVTNIAPGGIATDFAMGSGRTPEMPELEGMMSAEEVADVVLFAVSRPRGMRMLTMSFRPMDEASWG
jgi:3-oxoacyl-[acyl-carrier protein] reductase